MRDAVNALLICCALFALQALSPIAAPAGADGDEPEERSLREGEDRWVPSLAIMGGANFQNQDGSADSFFFEDMDPTPVPLRGPVAGDDLSVAPFVGGALELMTPALPVPTRPRLFVSGEILPTFTSVRAPAVEGDPGCIRGPEPDAPCASVEIEDEDIVRVDAFSEDIANGKGTKVNTEMGDLVYGAGVGVAFSFRARGRQLRIKPSFGWIHYEVKAEGLAVDAMCTPSIRCTDTHPRLWDPDYTELGFLREMTLTAGASERFHGIGPGLDIEVDTGRFGPIGTSLFLGGRAYRVLGDRTISFGETQAYPQLPEAPVTGITPLPPGVGEARFEVEVDPWIYRAHVGIRFQWLGSRK